MLKHQLQQEQLQTLQLQHQQLLQHLKILKQPKPQQKLQVLAHVLQQILTLSDLLQTVVQHLTVLLVISQMLVLWQQVVAVVVIHVL